jgi:histidinol-phosphate phosphatase family protein
VRPAAFLDRDGTLIEDRGYAFRLSDYAPLPGAHEAVSRLRAAGYAVIVISNQSGVGRGYFSPSELERFEAHLRADFAAHGAPLDALYSCPHAPAAGCRCRKPEPGLVERAAAEHALDLARSWVIGDRSSDVELARRAGCKAVLVGDGPGEAAPGALHAADVLDAVRRILAATGRSAPRS